jgi:hypothetical protein
MNKEEVIKLFLKTRGISAFSRNLIEWFYRNGYLILSPREVKFYNKKLNERSADK